jgi:putative oxidoreductase
MSSMAPTPTLIVPRVRAFFERLEPVAYLLLRIGFGLTLMTHGVPKLLGASHGSMADPMAASTNLIANVLQLPGAPLIAWAVALLEGVGGLMLALGLLSRLVAPLVLVQMLVICYLLGPTYPWIDRGIEYPVVLALLAFYIACRGSGRVALDAR